ncbi:MAG: DinB family protein [Anaerolineae bacterium]|nr:DinB family protein [Anaerolineae bacterium]
MTADDFRKLYEYHFARNRTIWDRCIVPLSDEQFTQNLDYSVGSLRNQMVHMLNIDDRWFSGLRGEAIPDFLNPVHFPKRSAIREQWDTVETHMRAYLDQLTDNDLQGSLGDLKTWEVLFHVLNHGTDHRAQVLAMLHLIGAPTFPQDYVYFAWGKDV